MIWSKTVVAIIAALGIGATGVAVQQGVFSGKPDTQAATGADTAAAAFPLTIRSANGAHVFRVEPARTEAEQQRGLMYRTDLTPDGGMLFWPYPPDGAAPREANFWMKNTPSPLDIVYIRADHTIARIAENTVPFSESPIPSGEPVGAVLEIKGGRSAELGIAEGDRVEWADGR